MNTPILTTEEKTESKLILIVDKLGIIGEALARELSKDYFVFLVSSKPLSGFNKKIISINFKGRIPKVPVNNYSKIFVIDDGNHITRQSALSFIKKAKLTNAEVYFIGSLRNIDLTHSDEIIKSYEKVKVLIFGDLFDNEVLFDRNTSITRFLVEARKNKKIKVRGDGLSLNYPISFKDTIKLIVKSIYIKIPSRAILLFSQHPITDISLANSFKKIDPDIDVDFISSSGSQKLYIPNNHQFALAKYDLIKSLREIDLNLKPEDKFDYRKKTNNFNFLKPVVFFLLACLFLLLLPLFSTYTYSLLGFSQIESAKKAAEKGEFEKSLGKINNARTFFELSKQTSGPLIYEASLIGAEGRIDSVTKKINAGIGISDASSSLLNGIVSFKNIKSVDDLNISVNYFKNSNILLQELKATNQFPKNMSEDLQNIMPLIEIISNSSDVMSQILGFDKEKRYIILFHNNLVLRPGGGIIDSIGIINVKNGKVISFKLSETSELDKNLNAFVAPPFYLRRYLATDNYYLKDSSSNADFINSAIDSSSIYEIITKEKVDGVIGINLNMAKKIISSKNFSNLVNDPQMKSDNFYDYLSKQNNKSNYLFYSNIINSLSKNNEKKNIEYFTFSEILGKSIIEKDILFAFTDFNIQNIFTVNNLSNTLIDKRRIDKVAVNDFFGISEGNVSEDKVSHLISRSVSRDLRINENNEFISSVKISFKNNNQNTTLGNYKNYLQIILPLGSRIQEVSVGGREVEVVQAVKDPAVYESNNFKQPTGFEIDQTNFVDKSIFGFLIKLPPESVRVITVNYSLPFIFTTSENLAKYSLMIYKQPGIESFPFEQRFNFSKEFRVLPSESLSLEIRKNETLNYLISKDN